MIKVWNFYQRNLLKNRKLFDRKFIIETVILKFSRSSKIEIEHFYVLFFSWKRAFKVLKVRQTRRSTFAAISSETREVNFYLRFLLFFTLAQCYYLGSVIQHDCYLYFKPSISIKISNILYFTTWKNLDSTIKLDNKHHKNFQNSRIKISLENPPQISGFEI